MLAALFFKKAGKTQQELKARMARASLGNEQPGVLSKADFNRERAEILEFGQRSDLIEFISLRYVPALRGNAIDEFIALCPELKEADSTLWFRNTPQDGAALLYANSFANGSLSAIYENWPKILMTGEPMGTPWRLAIWCLVSDFMIGRVWDDYGMASTDDCLKIWRMLARALALGGDSSKSAAEQLSRLEQRCGGNAQESIEGGDYPEEG